MPVTLMQYCGNQAYDLLVDLYAYTWIQYFFDEPWELKCGYRLNEFQQEFVWILITTGALFQ